MRATTLWTALMLSTVFFAAQANAEKTTYANQVGPRTLGQETTSGNRSVPGGGHAMQQPMGHGPQHAGGYHPQAAMAYGPPMAMPPQQSPYGVMPAAYGGGYGMGVPSVAGPMGSDPHVMPASYGGCPTCGGGGCDHCLGGGLGYGGLGHGDACGTACGLMGGGIFCGFSRGIGNAWDMSAYGGRAAPRYFDVAVDATFFVYEAGNQRINLASQGTANNFVLNTDDADFDHEAGLRISAQRVILPGAFLEFSYVGIGNYSGGEDIFGNGDLYSALSEFGTNPPGGFAETDGGDLQAFGVSNRFDSFELNLRRFWTSADNWWQGSYWGGIRYVRVEDDAIMISQGSGGSLLYGIGAVNDLFGAQIGGDLALRLTTRLTMTGFAEVGVYGNRGKQDTRLEFGGVTLNEDAVEKRASMVAEGGVLGTFRITPRSTFRFGYQVIYIDGIALASDAFNFETTGAAPLGTALAGRSGQINDNGHALYHGPTIGFECTW